MTTEGRRCQSRRAEWVVDVGGSVKGEEKEREARGKGDGTGDGAVWAVGNSRAAGRAAKSEGQVRGRFTQDR